MTRLGITKVNGTLEIDHERGVIYFHLTDIADVKKYDLITPLRICGLGRIPSLRGGNQIDITATQKGKEE